MHTFSRTSLYKIKNSNCLCCEHFQAEMLIEWHLNVCVWVCCVSCFHAYHPRYSVTEQGAGTDDNTLIRVMATRSEVDMMDIRAHYRRLFAGSLHTAIKVGVHTHTTCHATDTHTRLFIHIYYYIFIFRAFSRRFCPKWRRTVHACINTDGGVNHAWWQPCMVDI